MLRSMEPVIRLSFADLERERVESASDDVHFPAALVRAVLDEYSSPGDTVLDPFAGYGTTLVVGAEMGRSCVGIELLPDRVDVIRQKLGSKGRVIQGDARKRRPWTSGLSTCASPRRRT